MSWGEIFFGFHGRINRKIYWLASVAVALAGLPFNALLAYLATGNLFTPEVWQDTPARNGAWELIWLANIAFLAWPMSAITVKRLHDRNRPGTLWYVYAGGAILLSLAFQLTPEPAEKSVGLATGAVTLFMLAVYLFFEVAVLRGTPGPNAYGADTLPPDYFGGDRNIFSWMLALEGRIGRRSWWLGFAILFAVWIAIMTVLAGILAPIVARHPEFQRAAPDPAWIESAEAEPFRRWVEIFLPILILSLWSFIALGVKRLQDRSLSGWLILVVALPLLAVIFSSNPAQSPFGENFAALAQLFLLASAIWSVLQFGIFKGETGPNRHGPDPLAERS